MLSLPNNFNKPLFEVDLFYNENDITSLRWVSEIYHSLQQYNAFLTINKNPITHHDSKINFYIQYNTILAVKESDTEQIRNEIESILQEYINEFNENI